MTREPRPRPTATTPILGWAACAAAACAFLFAAPGIYWGLGGTHGLDTLGGVIEERALGRDPALMAANWVELWFSSGGGSSASP